MLKRRPVVILRLGEADWNALRESRRGLHRIRFFGEYWLNLPAFSVPLAARLCGEPFFFGKPFFLEGHRAEISQPSDAIRGNQPASVTEEKTASTVASGAQVGRHERIVW